jgi:hypothetical protein
MHCSQHAPDAAEHGARMRACAWGSNRQFTQFMALLRLLLGVAIAAATGAGSNAHYPSNATTTAAGSGSRAPAPAPALLRRVLLTDAAEQRGAVCLDGTPGALYFAPATDPALSTTWVLFFEGGGWCYTEADCEARSKGDSGGSSGYKPTMDVATMGIFSTDPALSPDFAGANHVYMKYCDGNSFAGDRETPVKTATGATLHFRGRRILDAVLETLATDSFGLSKATDVLLSGCSAGGLSAILHADAIGDSLATRIAPATLRRFKVVPDSGFFLDSPNAEALEVFGPQMKAAFELANATGGLNAACVAKHVSSGDIWKCNMAQYLLRPTINYSESCWDSTSGHDNHCQAMSSHRSSCWETGTLTSTPSPPSCSSTRH